MDVAGVIDKLGSDTDGRLAIGDSVIAYVIPTGPHGGAYAEQIDIDPADVMFGISGISLVAGAPEQRDRAGRLLDLFLDGLRYRSEGLRPRSAR